MGLDMYLERMPRYKNATANDVSAVENFLGWAKAKIEGSEYAQCTFKEWCGRDNMPSKDYIEFYSNHYTTKYCDWDTEKKYGHKRIIEEAGYWRKCNQIHNWFVDNIQDGEDDCGYHREVTADDLNELLAVCKKVKEIAIMENTKITNGYSYQNGEKIPYYEDGARIVNANEVAALLPTQSGFFFGSTEYDSYYMDDIEHTIGVITKVLETTDFDTEMLYYCSSW